MMISKTILRGLSTAAAVVLASGAAQAGVVLDQSSFVSGYLSSAALTGMIPTGNPVHQTHLQTLTVGQSGQLTRLDLKIQHEGGAGNMVLMVFNSGWLGAGVPAGSYGNVLANKVFSGGSVPQDGSPGGFTGADTVTSFDLTAFNIFVSAGQELSFSVRSAEPYGTINYANLARSNVDYLGGRNYISSNIGLRYLDYGTQDIQFQTFVDVAGIPEPATWAMMIGGFGLAGAALRRRKATPAYA